MDYSILINKENPIDENYKVDNLISVGKVYSGDNERYTDKDILLEQETALALKEMLDDANKINPNIKVIPDSGYRSYQYQIDVLNYYIEKEGEEKARQRVAIPGTSEHHSGLAVDVAIFDNDKYLDDVTGNEAPISFLHQNAYKYGFIFRYPKGKEDITGIMNEPWHFRYVGKDLAKEIMLNDLTLEEWHKMKKNLNSEKHL